MKMTTVATISLRAIHLKNCQKGMPETNTTPKQFDFASGAEFPCWGWTHTINLPIFSILIGWICPYYDNFWMLHRYHHLDFASPLWDQHRASLDRFLFHCLGSSVQGGIGWRRKPLWNFQNIPIRQELPWLLFFDEDIFHAMMFVA